MNQKIKFLLLFLVLFAVAEYLNEYNKNRLVNRKLTSVIKELKINFDIVNETDKLDAQSINAFISNDKKILTILSQAVDANKTKQNLLRTELYKHL